MSEFMTMKEIRTAKIFRAGYCEIQEILRALNRIGYNSGVYGWNCDVYESNGVTVCTGYRNLKGEKIPAEIKDRYKKLARAAETWDDAKAVAERFFKELAKL